MVRFLAFFALLMLPIAGIAQEKASSAGKMADVADVPKFAPLKLELYPGAPAQVLPNDPLAPKTPQELMKVYHNQCLNSNTLPAMKEYQEMQCACTSAEISQSMNVKELWTMFSPTPEGDFEYARMLLLSYIPCLSQTVKKFIYDSCIGDKNVRAKLTKENTVCTCVSDNMSSYISETAATTIPGFVRTGFKKEEAVNDTLGYMITAPGFQMKSGTHMRNCIKLNERK